MSTKTRPLHESDLEESYGAALEDFLRLGDETCLHRAYELGRQAVRDRTSILDMIEMNYRTLGRILPARKSEEERTRAVEAAAAFFKETMSPYEMTNRAFGEANTALQSVNETLEKQVRRIASALHDEAGQLLAVVHIKLEEVGRSLPVEVRERLQEVRQVVDQIESQLRGLSHELRPPALDDQGLLPALEDLASVVFRRTGLRITVESRESQRFPKKIESALYRVVQEALTNACKHSRAHSVEVRLWREEETVCCSVEDDGVGFDHEAVSDGRVPHGLGLTNIHERLRTLGGACEIISKPGEGTRLKIRIPVEE